MSNTLEPLNADRRLFRIVHRLSSHFRLLGIDSPRATAEILVAHALGISRTDLYLQHDKPLNDEELESIRQLAQRRSAREPTAYIVGRREFWSLELSVSPDVLIPRPETERLVEAALELLPAGQAPARVFDLGTGSGAIAIALAVERPENRYFASDSSMGALIVARENAVRHGVADSILFFRGHWFAAVDARAPRFDLIVSNPPYVAWSEWRELQPEIREYEPQGALDGGPEGLDFIREIIGSAVPRLREGGWLLLEIGYRQADRVANIAREHAVYDPIEVLTDYGGNDRVVRMRKKRG